VTQEPPGNAIAEWFGFRVWPHVDASSAAHDYQTGRNCPFVTAATGSLTQCIKRNRTGLCTVSSNSNGPRQDWLACPFRILDTHFTLLDAVVRRLFRIPADERVILRPVTALQTESIRHEITDALAAAHTRVFVFSQLRLGGEVSIPQTPASPEIEVDASIVEILPDPGADQGFRLGQYGLFEVQTMDFHGSPLHAIANLQNARDQDPTGYHHALAAHPEWARDHVEGPNKANVFKRTIYQIILEIQLARDPDCAGFAIALPQAVWDSWRVHLGQPTIEPDADDPILWRLHTPQEEVRDPAVELVEPERAWIVVFDIDAASSESPHPLRIVRQVATTSAALIHFALEHAPQEAENRGALIRFKQALDTRVRAHWPRRRPTPRHDTSPRSPGSPDQVGEGELAVAESE